MKDITLNMELLNHQIIHFCELRSGDIFVSLDAETYKAIDAKKVFTKDLVSFTIPQNRREVLVNFLTEQ